MAKSIVEIDVNDEAFQRFQSIFAKYQAQLNKMPGDWAKVGAAQAKAARVGADGFKSEAMAIASITSALSQVVRNQNEVQRVSRNTHGIFRDIQRTTGDILSNVTKTGFQLAKWALFGGVAGLATGAFGVGALARGATQLRGDARGARVSPGQLQAGRINYGNYLDYEGLVGNIGSAQLDLGKRGQWAAMGLSQSDLKASPGDLVPKVLSLAMSRYKAFGSNTQGFNASGAGNFTDERTLQSLGLLPTGELDAAGANYRRDSASLNTSDKTLASWQMLQQQLSRAGDQIEKTFITGLVTLAPNIEHLSASIARAIEGFAKNPNMGQWIDDFGRGIEWAAKYLSSDEFRSDVSSFLNTMHKLAHPFDTVSDAIIAPGKEMFGNFFSGRGSQGLGLVLGGDAPQDIIRKWSHLDSLEKQHGLFPGTLDRIWNIESARGKYLLSPKGATGDFGFMPDTAREFGVDTNDFYSSAGGAARKFAGLVREYGGNIDKAAAAYNYGQGNLNKVLAKRPGDWMQYLPTETADYIDKVNLGSPVKSVREFGTLPATPGGVAVTVRNAAGSDLTVQSNGLAY